MVEDLTNKVAVITGGLGGIGYAIADAFLQINAKTVILLDVNDKRATEAVDTLNIKHGDKKAVYMKCDVTTDLETVGKKILSSYENIEVLVNSAGICDETSIRKTIDINTTGTVEWSMEFYEYMRKDRGGSGGTIINISSIYGYVIDEHIPIYKASKFAVMGFTYTLGHKKNYNKYGVRVIAVCPGATTTNILNTMKVSRDKDIEQETLAYLKTFPAQKPETFAEGVVKLLQNAESGTTWSIIAGEVIKN
ncbi:15-hydroxyprostaglandin dehydrogenase [NAD(+)]-like [Aphomia sociella]